VTTRVCAALSDATALALRAALPAGLAVMLAGVALAWLGRAAAVRGLTGLDWPFRSAIGLVATLLSLTAVAGVLHTAWSGWVAARPAG
jgi:type III secretory pathway component EscT